MRRLGQRRWDGAHPAQQEIAWGSTQEWLRIITGEALLIIDTMAFFVIAIGAIEMSNSVLGRRLRLHAVRARGP